MWALFSRFKLAGIIDISIKLRMFSCLVVPVMEYCSEVWGPDLLFSCDTLDKLWDNELQKIQNIFLRQLGKLRKSVPTTVVHKEMCMNPVAKGWLRASIDHPGPHLTQTRLLSSHHYAPPPFTSKAFMPHRHPFSAHELPVGLCAY